MPHHQLPVIHRYGVQGPPLCFAARIASTAGVKSVSRERLQQTLRHLGYRTPIGPMLGESAQELTYYMTI